MQAVEVIKWHHVFQMRKCLAICALLVVGWTLISCDDRATEEYYNGRSFAFSDKSNGNLKIAFVDGSIDEPAIDGTKVPSFYGCADVLNKRYHIQWVMFSLPADHHAAREWVRGYNEIMEPEIKARFGTNVFDQTIAEALKLRSDSAARP
jgi:hypothetical protein